MFPGQARSKPDDQSRTERRGGEPDTHHRRHSNLDHRKTRGHDKPMAEYHHRGLSSNTRLRFQALPAPVAGPAWAPLGVAREALKLSRATSAIPASDPIMDALSSGMRITFWFGVPASRPMASI